jgi:hypothetical protein
MVIHPNSQVLLIEEISANQRKGRPDRLFLKGHYQTEKGTGEQGQLNFLLDQIVILIYRP